jgi:hypothetical protein
MEPDNKGNEVSGRRLSWPLDLDGAVAVLNAVKHDYCVTWGKWNGKAVQNGGDPYAVLSEFEAVAVAERYLRDQIVSSLISSSERTRSGSEATASAILQIKVFT